MQSLLARLVRSFPREGLTAAFGYGSGVLAQMGAKGRKMVDFIFAVDDPRAWHQANLLLHPKHYSFLRLGGVAAIDAVQRGLPGPEMYFNTLVPTEDGQMLIKYGVVSTSDLVADLRCWSHLYAAGRLHKPVEWVVQNGGALATAQKRNLEQAASAALLLLPDTFSETELFLAITNLSYQGDFRMLVGEDRQKVENIVWAQMQRFRRLYNPILHDLPQVDWRSSLSELFLRDTSYEGQRALLQRLPLHILRQMAPVPGPPEGESEAEELATRLAENPDCQNRLRGVLEKTVWRSSLWATTKSVLSAGVVKSAVYGSQKVTKMVKSMFSGVARVRT